MTGFSAYLGLPQRDQGRDRTGVDCWGLARLVYRERLGIELPCYAGAYHDTGELAEIEALLAKGRDAGPWHPATDVRPYDLHLFRIGRYRVHVGIATDARHMLHVHTSASTIVPLAHPLWCHRLTGTYRHKALS